MPGIEPRFLRNSVRSMDTIRAELSLLFVGLELPKCLTSYLSKCKFADKITANAQTLNAKPYRRLTPTSSEALFILVVLHFSKVVT